MAQRENTIFHDINSEIHKLTENDRTLLKAFFGFTPVKELENNNLKNKHNAALFVRACLWPGKNKKQNKIEKKKQN